jgi:hypothetical protein
MSIPKNSVSISLRQHHEINPVPVPTSKTLGSILNIS